MFSRLETLGVFHIFFNDLAGETKTQFKRSTKYAITYILVCKVFWMIDNVTLESEMGCDHLKIGSLNLLSLVFTILKCHNHKPNFFDWSCFTVKRVDTDAPFLLPCGC